MKASPPTQLFRNLSHESEHSAADDHARPRTKSFEDLLVLHKNKIFTAVLTALFLGQVGFAVFAPFFPQEAAAKGISKSTLGWIFGIFQLAVVAFTPFTTRLLPLLGPTRLLNISNFLCASSNLIFGAAWATDDTTFLYLCFSTRIAMGIGVSIQMVVGYGLLPSLFPDKISTAASIMETALGFAFMVAPVIGSALYEAAGGAAGQGYTVPFYVLGIVQLVFGIGMLAFFPTLPKSTENESKGFGFSPKVFLPFCICIVTGASIEYVGPTLQPFLAAAPFNYSVSMVGVVFSVCSVVYTIAGPLVGMLDDKFEGRISVPVMAVGLVLSGVGYVLLAPTPWICSLLPIEVGTTGLWVGIQLLGLGGALGLIPTYGNMLQHATADDETDRSNATSALYNVAYGIGAFLGPTAGGVLGDRWGIVESYTDAGLFCLVLGLLAGVLGAVFGSTSESHHDMTEPLLS